MQKITPFLWFDSNAEEAANFYVSLFEGSKVNLVTRYSDENAGVSGRPAGSVMTVEFELAGQTFTALNGGPVFSFNESVSFVVHCKDQAELDRYWERLTADGGREVECGWLKDRFGLSWQIVPEELATFLSDPARAGRVMAALLKMKKLDIEALRTAYEGK